MITEEEMQALDAELQRSIDAFADHDWGEHRFEPWVIGHVLSMSSGMHALEWLRARGAA